MDIKDLVPEIEENVPLSSHSVYKIGGLARYFFSPKDTEDLVKVLKGAVVSGVPWIIIGSGSNVLFSDEGYGGLVIKPQNDEIRLEKEDGGETVLYVQAGAKLSSLASFALENSLEGLEDTVGIPGTVGGAIRGNAGSFGFTWAPVVEQVEFFDASKAAVASLGKNQCAFEYRNSIFKQNHNWVILAASIRLKKGDPSIIDKKMKENMAYKRKVQPLNFPSLGSIFKNYHGKITDETLLKEFPQLKEFNQKEIIPAGFLIEKCGLRGIKAGNAQISEKHANFFVNLGGAKSRDILQLISLAQDSVRKKFGISLEEEIYVVA